jgi:hypothetical protein
VRNIFDQYEQPENRLTHALTTVLDKDRSLLVPFLRWLGIQEIPKPRSLMLTEQQVPGILQQDAEDLDAKGLPDAAIFDDDGWAVLFECKVQAHVKIGQLIRHRETAKRHGFESSWIVVISVDECPANLPAKMVAKAWRDVYSWFNLRATKSPWAQELVHYMRVFERKLLSNDYQIRGTITVFDGLRFDEENPYTYREGKRLIRLLGDELQERNDLHDIRVDPKGERRSAITGKRAELVWDFLPLKVARGTDQFTSFPHLTMVIHRSYAAAAVTVPNGVKGGFKSKLSSLGIEGFRELMGELEHRTRSLLKLSPGARPLLYLSQRHFLSQSSPAERDAHLEADLRTSFQPGRSAVREQPQWLNAAYDLLINKRSNMQFGTEIRFRYSCPLLRSRKAADLFAETWKAFSPLIDFVVIN